MNANNGYIVIQRKMLEWQWYKDINTKILFIHCLLKANWRDSTFKGIKIPRGSFVTGLPILSSELNLTTSQVRTALNHLILTGTITTKIYSKFRIITVNNYNLYQNDSRENSSQMTGKSFENSSQMTIKSQSNDRQELMDNTFKNNSLSVMDDEEKNNKMTGKNFENSSHFATIEEINNKYINNNSNNNNNSNQEITEKNNDIFSYVERCFGRTLNPIEFQEIMTWDDNEATRYAVYETALKNIDSVSYVRTILNTYKKKKIKTYKEAQKEAEDFKNRKNPKNYNYCNSKNNSNKFNDELAEWKKRKEKEINDNR